MDDPKAIVVAVEEQVSALSGFSVELTVEDLQAWTKANKEDKSQMTTSLPPIKERLSSDTERMVK